ncbi:MAG TPA: hypothetical protein VGO15_00510 [Candidatus Limnocylindrales bacterium]|jgi:hypothetical protein|nr:hypothetical protein [Candidatus Limnocylindrales bacterium]
MDLTPILPFPSLADDPLERDLEAIGAAIELVKRGTATRVRLVALARPEAAASTGLARAQAADVRFAVERRSSGTSLTVGPRHARVRSI